MWRLLATITLRKAAEHARVEATQKRGGDHQIVSLDDSDRANAKAQPAPQPPPDISVMLEEECRRLLKMLDDSELEAVVLWKLEGLTNEEIARELNYSRRTIQRMLNLIRDAWCAEAN